MKELVVQDAPKQIKHIQFGVLSPQEIVNIAELEVTHRDCYSTLADGSRGPAVNGALDPRMGVSNKKTLCKTCGLKMVDCVGHYGYIKLVLPVFHIGFFKHTITMLQTVCKSCACVLLTEDDRRKYLRIFRRKNLENLTRSRTIKLVNMAARKVTNCPRCGAINGTVKKAGALKVVHEPYRAKKFADEKKEFHNTFETAVRMAKASGPATADLKPHLDRAQDDLNPLKVLELFKRISDEDCELLGLRPEFGRPEEYIWQYICVPPVCIRPSVQQEAGTNEDDITVKLNEIVFANQLIRAALQKGGKGATTNQLMEQWDFLQLSVGLYIHSEMPGQNQPTKKPGRGFCQRLKGKQGRFRGNLSGKRVDFSGRTVISPDPNLKIDELAVPERVAKILTYPERVNNYNLESLRIAVRNGNEVHPGANYVIDEVTGFKKFLRPKFAAAEAERLKVGDIVERHLKDGDIVLFNRQPSLHKLSIMSHRVKVRPWRTFRLNECACNPYNADFDGDEMNVHVPQTEEARTEATVLMGVKHNLVTPRNGEPLVAAIQDFITASFLISRRDRFFTRAQFTQACSYFADATQQIDIPSPAIHKPVRLWTGKQLFNCLIRPNHDSPVRVNLEAQCRTFEKPSDDPPMPGAAPYIKDMSPNDGWLVIQNSEVMCGVMDKSTVGDGKKNSLFGVILRDYGSDAAIVSMNRLAKTCARWLANQGFSLGINDVMPGEQLRATKDSKVERAYAECLDLIEKAKKGKLENLPGCDQEQTLENMISGVLSAVRAAVGEICMTELSRHNAPLIMAVSGSKGSKINVAQMVACVGQQIIAGSRVPNGFQDRSLPQFPKKSKDPPSKGFVRNSFFSGLTPTEFLFHAISGREGLVDTAVKTAETGYMQRRLMKALEDLSTHYDLSVRNSVGGVVQFEYGNDGLDPAELEGDGTPVEYRRTWRNAIALTLYQEGAGLLPYEIMEMCEAELVPPVGPPPMIDPVTGQPSRIPPPPTAPQKRFDACDPQFCEDTLKFVRESVVEPAAAIRNAHGMYPALTRPDHGNVNLMEGVDAAGIAIVDNKTKIKKVAVQAFLDMCYSKYMRSKVEPGTAVGAVGAQSIGEPGTQMTLKTFHFAGVASMNVTLGVPRIKEIINAAKLINTPIITAKLVNNQTERAARIVKGRIEKTYLGDIASVLEEAWAASYVYIGIHIDMDAVRRLQLELTLDDIMIAIVRAPKLKIKMEHITVVPRKNRLRIQIHEGGEKEIYYALKTVKRALPSIVVKGIKEATRAVISVDREAMDDEDQRRKVQVKQQLEAGETPEKFEAMPEMKGLLVEGYGLREVMNTDGVIGTQTKTNHIMEMHQVLGIEASRQTIFNEINHTMGAHGMSIDPRHVRLLADVMTYKGEVLGITRFGVAKMKDSVLMLASFEKTTDHLFDAALFGKTDAIQGVSESIIMGNPAGTVGTGMPALVTPKPYCPPRRELIFDRDFD